MGTGGDESGVDPRVAFQHGAQVPELPASAAFDTEHVDPFVHNPDAARHPVVRGGGFVGKWFNRNLDPRRTFFGNIDIEKDLFKLQSASKRDALADDAPPIEAHRQICDTFLVAFRLELNTNRNLIAGKGDILHDDVADRDIVRVGDSHRHGVNRDPAPAQIAHRCLNTPRRSIESVRDQYNTRQRCTAPRLRHRLQRSRNRGARPVGLQPG